MKLSSWITSAYVATMLVGGCTATAPEIAPPASADGGDAAPTGFAWEPPSPAVCWLRGGSARPGRV